MAQLNGKSERGYSMVGIVILNYMNWEVTYNCIMSIRETAEDVDYHIYLVDNASTTPMPKKISEAIEYEDITFIASKKNGGYSAGNNIGTKAALEDKCKYILISNSDIIFKKDSIKALRDYLNSNPKVGIVGPQLLNSDMEIYYCHTTSQMRMAKVFFGAILHPLYSALRKAVKKGRTHPGKIYTEPINVCTVQGCCFMVSLRCALEITPFDENVFLYSEEYILGIIMEEKGYLTTYYPQSEVIHMDKQSSSHTKAYSFIYQTESLMYYCKRYLKANAFQMASLYIVYAFQYMYRALFNADYRVNMKKYFKGTWARAF